MLNIYYNNQLNRFDIKIIYDEVDIFEEYQEVFSQAYIQWDKVNRVRYFNVDRFNEMSLWFDKKGVSVSYDPSCKEIYNLYLSSFKPDIIYNRNVILDYSILNPGQELLPFQKEGVEWILSKNKNYLADEPGLGKTLQAIFSFSQLYKEGKIDFIFIVVKTGLSYNWLKEILYFVNVYKEEDILIINNENKKQPFEANKDKKIIIVPNHLIADVFLSYKKKHNLNKSAKLIRWKSYVDLNKIYGNNLMVVLDEAHEFNNSKAVRTKAILHHLDFFKYRLALSATCSGNYFENYYNACKLLDSKLLPFNEKEFNLFISNEIGGIYNPYEIISYNENNVEKIKNLYLTKFFRKKLKIDVPEFKYKQFPKDIKIELSNYHKFLYREFLQNEINIIEQQKEIITIKLIMNKFPYLVQALDNPFLLQGRIENEKVASIFNKWKKEYDEKFLLLKSLLDSYVYEQGEKVVIFDNHPTSLNWLAEEFKKYNPLLMHGGLGLKEKDKKDIEDLFNDRKNKHKILLCNPQVGGTGTNFNRGGRRIIFYTMPSDAVLSEQAMQRVYRINNIEDSYVEFLLYDHSIDLLRYNRNINRMKLNEKFLNQVLSKEELRNLLEGSL